MPRFPPLRFIQHLPSDRCHARHRSRATGRCRTNLNKPGRTRTSSIWRANANGRFQARRSKAGGGAVDEPGQPRHSPPRRLFHEVSHGLPSCPKLRLALGHVVPERHIPGCRVIHHPLQQCRGHELFGDARKRRAQPVALHLGSRLLIDQLRGFLASTIGNRGSSALG